MRAILIASVSAAAIQVPVFILYSIIPALLGGVSWSQIFNFVLFVSFWVLAIASAIVVLIGIPVFLWMCRKNHLTAGKITMVGFGIPSVLALVWLWPLSPGSGFSSGMSYHGTYRRMIDDGVPTFWGWVGFVEDLVIFGLHGAVGAIIFFLVWRKVERGSYAP